MQLGAIEISQNWRDLSCRMQVQSFDPDKLSKSDTLTNV